MKLWEMNSTMDDRAYVFLDANILLHFRPPNEIDWPSLCRAKQVDLVIYPLLRTEVSNQKDMHREKHIRKRAGQRAAEIREWLTKPDTPIRNNVFVHRDGGEPRELLDALGLDREVRDDRIIAHAVSYLRDGKSVLVATADEGLEMKLEDQGIPVIVLPDNLRLPPEPDPDKRRADKAEAELRVLRSRLPAFELSTAPVLVLTRQRGFGDVEDYARRCLEAVQEEYEREQHARYGGRQPPRVDSIFERPNRDYIEDAKAYLRARHHWLTQSEGAMWAQLVVRNTGNLTATGVRVKLSFPDGIVPFTDGGFDNPPPRPHLPAAFEALFADHPGGGLWMAHTLGYAGNGAPKVDRPNRSVAVTWDRIPQHDEVHSGRIWAVAGGGARPGESAAQVSTLCEEIPGKTEMHVPFTVVERDPAGGGSGS